MLLWWLAVVDCWCWLLLVGVGVCCCCVFLVLVVAGCVDRRFSRVDVACV